MFDLEAGILEWRQQMLAAGVKAPVPLDELETHLRDHIDRLKAGVSEEEAFHSATQQLGGGKILKQEFSKVKRHGLWSVRSNPLALTIIAVWFLVMGLEDFSPFIHRLYLSVEWWPVFHLHNLNLLLDRYTCFAILAGCLTIFIGTGLLRRQNGWRITAVVMLSYKICMETFFLQEIHSHYEKWSSANYYPSSLCYLMGLRFPFVSIYFFPILNIALSCWAIYLLTRSTVRNVFRPATAN